MATKIIKCKKCKPHKFQDERYGQNERVHNLAKDKQKTGGYVYRCTVCLNEKSV